MNYIIISFDNYCMINSNDFKKEYGIQFIKIKTEFLTSRYFIACLSTKINADELFNLININMNGYYKIYKYCVNNSFDRMDLYNNFNSKIERLSKQINLRIVLIGKIKQCLSVANKLTNNPLNITTRLIPYKYVQPIKRISRNENVFILIPDTMANNDNLEYLTKSELENKFGLYDKYDFDTCENNGLIYYDFEWQFKRFLYYSKYSDKIILIVKDLESLDKYEDLLNDYIYFNCD